MPGKLIISLDCEGKWGVADRPSTGREFISSSGLVDIYSRILDIFDRHRFRATFAFVAALCLEPDELMEEASGVELPYGQTDWLTNPMRDLESGSADGWCVPELLRVVSSANTHHICTHGGTHVPYSDALTPPDVVEWDLRFAKQQHERLGLGWGSIVLPRNITGHLGKLIDAGITSFRSMDRPEQIFGGIGKATRVMYEFTNADKSDLLGAGRVLFGRPRPLSPGKFINARIGMRRYVPAAVTIYRARTLLAHACSHDKVLHLYTHPHNFISDPEMVLKMDAILSLAGHFSREVGLEIFTMEDEFNAAG